jgi:hypothetical protein
VSTTDTSPSDNRRGSETWFRSWTHLGIDRRSPGYCRVTFDHPGGPAPTAGSPPRHAGPWVRFAPTRELELGWAMRSAYLLLLDLFGKRD